MTDKSHKPVLSEREQSILRTLVDEYIREGVPLGSRTLSKLPGVGLSAASVRNVMGDLEEQGLLHAAHSSAGRVPTDNAYRLFVDSMVQYQAMDEQSIDSLRSGLQSPLNRDQLIARASEYLSGFTNMAGLVFVPKPPEDIFRQIDFVPLSEKRVLVIFVINDHDVENRVVSLDRDYSRDELIEAANFLNQSYRDQSLSVVRDKVRASLQDISCEMADQMQRMISVAGQVFQDDDHSDSSSVSSGVRGDFAVAGQTNLMACQELSDLEQLRSLFDTFNSQRDMFHILERSLSADGVKIFIGAESGHQVLDHCSVVTAPCEQDGEILGVLGVIGPTRMAYDRVVPLVDVTSKILGSALNFNR